MNRPFPCSEADWMMETIVEDFAQSLDLPDRVNFYARLVELLTEQRNRVERMLDGVGPEPSSPEQLH